MPIYRSFKEIWRRVSPILFSLWMLGDMSLDGVQTYTYWEYSPDLNWNHEFHVVRNVCHKLVDNQTFKFTLTELNLDQVSQHDHWVYMCNDMTNAEAHSHKYNRRHFCNTNNAVKLQFYVRDLTTPSSHYLQRQQDEQMNQVCQCWL